MSAWIATPHQGQVYVDDELSDGINRSIQSALHVQRASIRARCQAAAIATDLGPAVLLADLMFAAGEPE